MTFQSTFANIDTEMRRLGDELARMTEERDYWKDMAQERGTLDQRSRLRTALGIGPAESMILAAMYARKGGVLRKTELDDVVPPSDHAVERDQHVMNVWICRLRRKLGSGVIETVWGEGHRLTTIGFDLITRALEAR